MGPPSRRVLRARRLTVRGTGRRTRLTRLGAAVLCASAVGGGLVGLQAVASPTDGSDKVTMATEETDSDTRAVELGLRFRPLTDGWVQGIQFTKAPENGGTHVGTLWSGSGRKLATATFTSETASGVQRVTFARPVQVSAGRVYVASYFAPMGRYTINVGRFSTGRRIGPIMVPANGGVYIYGGGFPTMSWRASDYTVYPIIAGSPNGIPTVPVPTATRPTPAPVTTTPDQPPTPPVVTGTATAAPTATVVVPPVPPVTPPAAGSCLSAPSRCGYPDETNTGPRGTLTKYSGPMDITTSGTVIKDKLIEGNLRIHANNVVIRNSKVVNTANNSDASVIRVWENFTNVLIEDVEVTGAGKPCGIAVELAGTNGTVRRVNAHGCADHFRTNKGSTIVDSYGHDRWNGPGVHSDGVQALGDSNLTIRHNTLLLDDGSGVNNVIAIGGEYGRPSNIVVKDNLLDGGGYTIGIDPNATGVTISGNRFGRNFSYGAIRLNGAPATVGGNVWDDGRGAVGTSG